MKASEMIKVLKEHPDFEVVMSEERIDYANNHINVSDFTVIDFCDIGYSDKVLIFDIGKRGK